MGAAGVLAVPLQYSRADVESMIQEARLFAAEWAELRAVHKNRLHGYCLRVPLKVQPVIRGVLVSVYTSDDIEERESRISTGQRDEKYCTRPEDAHCSLNLEILNRQKPSVSPFFWLPC